MKHKVKKRLVIWLFTGLILIAAMVVIGGITRLTGSGLSMVDWKLFMDAIPPISEVEWQNKYTQYKQFPEYQHVNFDFTLTDFKQIYFWEYLHRLIGRLIGIVFLIPFIYFISTRQLSFTLTKKLTLLLILGGFQGFLGWFMVKSGLKNEPDVSHYRLAVHLISAFVLFGYLLWVILEIKYPKVINVSRENFKLRWALVLLLILVTMQVIYGAFVAGLDAGMVYNTFPKMGDLWIAESVTAMTPMYLNFIEGIGGVQFIHRTLAWMILVFSGYLFIKSRVVYLKPIQKKGFLFLFLSVGLQFLFGVLTLLNAVPVYLGILHQFGALLLLTSIIFILYQLKSTPEKF